MEELITDTPDSKPAHLHPLANVLADALRLEADGRVQIVRDDKQGWLAMEEIAGTIAFAEAQGDELRIVPFVGDEDVTRTRPYTLSIGPGWLDDAQELVVSLPRTLSR